MSPIQATKWRHKLYKKSYTTYVANSAAKNLNWRQKLYKIRLPKVSTFIKKVSPFFIPANLVFRILMNLFDSYYS